jgi:mercuric reductase
MEIDPPELFRDVQETIRTLRERNYVPMLSSFDALREIRGWARFVDASTVEVNGEQIHGDAVLIATGSRTDLSQTGNLDSSRVLSNENFFSLTDLPESVLVLGGGYIAVELAQMLVRFGVKVTTLQRSGTVLSSQPAWVGEELGEHLRDEGMDLLCGTTVLELKEGGKGVEARIQVDGEERTVTAEYVLMARGRRGNTETLELDRIGITPDQSGYLKVDDRFQTSCPGVYAVGDVLGGHMLVYTASAEAERMVSGWMGGPVSPIPGEDVPWVVFTDPQVAGVGLSAEEAVAQGLPVDEAELPVSRWPRFSTVHETRGMLKLYRNPETDLLLGARAICPEAGDLMSELALIRDHRIPLNTIADRMVPYLTLNEGIQRCAAKFHYG